MGSGVMEVLETHRERIAQQAGMELSVKSILDLREFPDLPYHDRFTKDFNDIVNDPEIRIVVECMGGLSPAYEFGRACLNSGKSLITSNKQLVAERGHELLALAKEHSVSFLFEASVGGGVPIIRPLSQCLAANEITAVCGVLNGTTNFILTQMENCRGEFAEFVRQAQQMGYAERDPSDDIGGADTCRKISILSSIVFGSHVPPESVFTRGVESIACDDLIYAQAMGRTVKLVGEARRLDHGKISVCVSPMLVKRDGPLGRVEGANNVILVRGDVAGDVTFHGMGAGKLPTASAIAADLIDCARHLETGRRLSWGEPVPGLISPFEEQPRVYFLRLSRGPGSEREKALLRELLPAYRPVELESPGCETYGLTAFTTWRHLEACAEKLKAAGYSVESRLPVSDLS